MTMRTWLRCPGRGSLPALLLLAWTSAPVAQAPGPARQGELLELLAQDCGACHGMTLRGGLGPALTPAALADRDAGDLRAVILGGRPGTAMPPWRALLSEEDVDWLVEVLLGIAADGVAEARHDASLH